MGREAFVHAEVGAEAGEVRVLLESTEMILRGDIKRRYPRAEIQQLAVEGEVLRFLSGGDAVRLHLGEKIARSWADVIAKPPPGLRAKLGLETGALALILGSVTDEALEEATSGSAVTSGAAAQMIIAVIDGPDSLAEAQRVQGDFPSLPIWTVYPKGRGVVFGDTAIRTVLRQAGFRDTKSCAVSDSLTATRYNR